MTALHFDHEVDSSLEHDGRRHPTTSSAVEVHDLTVSVRRGKSLIEIVRGVSFDLIPGRTLVILGESGSGKSVTARAIMRLAPETAVTSGTVRLINDDMLALSPKEAARRRGSSIALVPQDPAGALSPLRRIGSQIAEVLLVHKMVDSRKEATERALELLGRVGIPDPRRIAKVYPHELSGGMRQRVAIAIAVAGDPTVLVADEPTTALDVTVQAQILDLFQDLQERLGMALLLVTHDVGVAQRMGDEVAVMYAGRIVEHGPADLVLTAPTHPYTAALLRALPKPTTARGALVPIPGQPPSPTARPSGCPFRVRCQMATADCADVEPMLSLAPTGIATACLRSSLDVMPTQKAG
jgi:oligopeptide/dipeptide ABC transporter ATP-binding protein